jgi:iron complex transport system substrate-binding protein
MVAGCQPQFQPGTYTDDMGRAVAIDQAPQRIVSFGPSITEILFALGLEEKVVGVSNYCDYPEAAKLKAKVGDAFNPSLERIVELEPDLVLTLKQEQLNRELDALGIKFMVLDPEDIDGIWGDIELVGEITGTEKKAEELIEDMQDSISQVIALVEDAPEVRVFFIVDATDLTLPWTAGTGSFIDALITMAGGENIAAKAQGAWVQFSLEQIVSADPEIIVIQTMTGGIPTVSKEGLEEHPVWGEMTAVKQGKICFINGDLVSRPGPRIVQGLEEMAKIIHPELFE